MKNSKNVHVIPNGNQWSAKTEGSSRASKNFDLQSDAIQHARGMAMKNNSELLIHGRNGQIREKNSYGNDPKNIKG